MARTKRENTWKNLSIQIDEKLYNLLKDEAESEARTLCYVRPNGAVSPQSRSDHPGSDGVLAS